MHCLARDAAESGPQRDPPAEVVEEGVFRAARFGLSGRLPDAAGELRPVADLFEETLERVAGHATELGCSEELDGLRELLACGGGAGIQRERFEIAGLDAVVRKLTELTAADAAAPAG